MDGGGGERSELLVVVAAGMGTYSSHGRHGVGTTNYHHVQLVTHH